MFDKPKSSDYVTLTHPEPVSTFHDIVEIYIPRALAQSHKAGKYFRDTQLQGKPLFEQIWNWCRANFHYKEDKEGTEQIRLPRQSWADRKKGIDCEDFVILISSILHYLDEPHTVRMADYGDGWQHIYIVADGVVIDPVNSKFNNEVPYKRKLDFRFSGWSGKALGSIPANLLPKSNKAMLTAAQRRLKKVSERADKLVEKAGTHKVTMVVNNLNRKDAMKKAWAAEKAQDSVASRTMDGIKKRKKKATTKKKPATKKKATTKRKTSKK